MKNKCWSNSGKGRFFPTILITSVCFGLLCSCKKSENDEVASRANEDAARVSKYVKTGMENWIKTNSAYLQTNGDGLAIAKNLSKVGPELARSAITNEVLLETERAALALQQIYAQGQLPGVAESDHGKMGFDTIDLVVSNNPTIISYPALRKFYLVKDGETFTNHYILGKESKDAEWKLQRAWETDSNGQVIQEWPIK
jgi:hypothetical protein